MAPSRTEHRVRYVASSSVGAPSELDASWRTRRGERGGVGPQVPAMTRGKVRTFRSGGASGTRTRNPLLAKQVRYHLRHGPVWSCRPWWSGERVGDLGPQIALVTLLRQTPPYEHGRCHRAGQEEQSLHVASLRLPRVVGLAGLEPATSSLSGKRSNRLSYRPAQAAPDEAGAARGYPSGAARPKPDRRQLPTGVRSATLSRR